MKRTLFGIVAIFLLFPCARTGSANEPEPVSIIQLIAHPEEYQGKFVRIHGYVVLTFEGNAIYLSEESAKHGLTENGLWLDTSYDKASPAEYSNQYCLVEGIFDATSKGHMSLWRGQITKITRIDLSNFDITDEDKAAKQN
ncbi:MAG: hypothetical protein ACM3L6_03700 [Deltaproteobacteria bacterium]